MNVKACKKASADVMENKNVPNVTYVTTRDTPTWETWHQCYSHISYDGLMKLYKNNLVKGFLVNENSSQPDCMACTEAKMIKQPFKGKILQQVLPGMHTHIDVWGKYEVASIYGHQYYLLFVDDASHYTMVNFLKSKDEVSSQVKDYYLTYQITHYKPPHAICIDRGTVFVNETLKLWCHKQGIEIQLTAPYSPSQNGIAERTNRTLVELTCTMIRGQNLPEFLWEHAIEHAAYLRNCAYT
jgi:hypothetical protein